MTQQLSSFDARVCEWAWRALIVVLPFVCWRLAKTARRDLLLALVLAVLALIPRLLLPWGPLNFVEAERLFPLWTQGDKALNEFLAIPLALMRLQQLGLSLETILHRVEPFIGALSVALTYGCARAFQLERRYGVLAAVLVACSPAHLHFSESLSFSVDAGALAVATLAAAASLSLGWLAIPMITVLTTITVHTRPEMRFLLIPLAFVVFWRGTHWSIAKRWALAICLAMALASYLPMVLKPQAQTIVVLDMRPHPFEIAEWFVRTFLFNGWPWIVIAAIGFFRKSLPAHLRWSLLSGIVVLGIVYWFLASDPSYLWTQWRYYVTLVPLLAVATSSEIARWWPKQGTRVVAVCVAALLGLVAFEWHLLRLQNDQQVEFHYVRETAAAVMPPSRELYVAQFKDCWLCEGSAALALSTLYGPIEISSEGEKGGSAVRVRLLNEKNATPDLSGVIYIGSRLRTEVLQLLSRQYDVTPVQERTVEAVADHRQCGVRSQADSTKLCALHMGWYRFQPRSPAAPVLGSGD